MLATGDHYMVAIIGSGPTGLSAANLLGTMGIPTLLVERNQTTVQEPRAVSIDDESLRTLQAIGIINAVLDTVVAGYGSYYYSPRGVLFTKVEPSGRPYGYPRRNAFRQPVLERQLRDGLSRFDSITTRFGWTLLDYTLEQNVVRLDLSDASGQRRSVTCDYLIGSDGAASSVRDAQDIRLKGTTFNERWLIVDLENVSSQHKHTEVFCDSSRPCITLPGPDRTRRYEFKLLPGETDRDMLAAESVSGLLRSRHADPQASLRRKAVYRFHARVATKWSVGRMFLAGDAAHLTPPFAGQGMNSGIRDAHNLCWKLAAVLQGWLGPGLLATYEPERKHHVWQMIRLALGMGRIMSPRNRLVGMCTQTVFRALNRIPYARDYILQMRYKPAPRFRHGFLIPDRRGRRSIVGRMFPQPLVEQPDGARVLLDMVLGGGFALVLRTSAPAEDFALLKHPVWQDLDLRRVALLPSGSRSRPHDGITAVVEADPALDRFLDGYDRCAVLLRPDHYVAASVPLDTPDAVALELEALIETTWSGSRPARIRPPEGPFPSNAARSGSDATQPLGDRQNVASHDALR